MQRLFAEDRGEPRPAAKIPDAARETATNVVERLELLRIPVERRVDEMPRWVSRYLGLRRKLPGMRRRLAEGDEAFGEPE